MKKILMVAFLGIIIGTLTNTASADESCLSGRVAKKAIKKSIRTIGKAMREERSYRTEGHFNINRCGEVFYGGDLSDSFDNGFHRLEFLAKHLCNDPAREAFQFKINEIRNQCLCDNGLGGLEPRLVWKVDCLENIYRDLNTSLELIR